MKSEPCTYSQEQEEESSQISFLDTDPSLLSNGMPTLAASLEPELMMDGLMECTCGKETSECSIHPTTKDKWIASMRDSLAKILVSQELNVALEKVRALDFTEKSYALQTRFDLNTSSWRMSQESLLEMTDECYEPSLEILPTAAMMQFGLVFPLPKLAHLISEIDGGSLLHTPTAKANQMAPSMIERSQWATPTTMDHLPPKSEKALKREMEITRPGRSKPATLRDQVSNMKMWPTPDANCGARGTQPNWTPKRKSGQPAQYTLNQAVRDQLWPTPSARDYKGANGYERTVTKLQKGERAQMGQLPNAVMMGEGESISGKLNPMWVEWLMGWLLGWTDLKPLEMDKSPCAPQQLGKS